MRSLTIYSAALAAAGALAACGDVTTISPAVYPNRTDTVSVYALSGTPVTSPSAYLIYPNRQVVRTDQSSSFDVAFDIDTLGRTVVLPTGAMRLGRQSGVQLSTLPFDSVLLGPSSGYQVDSAVVVGVNSVAIIHSRAAQCSFDVSPIHNYFAKLHVLAIDTTARRIDLEILTDINCGYRGLEPGLPKQ